MKKYTEKINMVIFDVDSTLVTFEGLDWLAEQKGCADKAIELTRKSMEGTMDFAKALSTKMEMLRPSYKDMIGLGKQYCAHLTPEALQSIKVLHKKGIEVWIITGSFNPAVRMLASKLTIPESRVLCNELIFDQNGEYVDYDRQKPMTRNNGKMQEIQRIAQGKHAAMVGDGMTDLEAKSVVDLFVGFGGVVERKIVKERADVYIKEASLHPLIDVVVDHKIGQ